MAHCMRLRTLCSNVKDGMRKHLVHHCLEVHTIICAIGPARFCQLVHFAQHEVQWLWLNYSCFIQYRPKKDPALRRPVRADVV